MHSGDILLIQGTWDSIARMSHKQSQWVVLGQPVEEDIQSHAGLQSTCRRPDHDLHDRGNGIRFSFRFLRSQPS